MTIVIYATMVVLGFLVFFILWRSLRNKYYGEWTDPQVGFLVMGVPHGGIFGDITPYGSLTRFIEQIMEAKDPKEQIRLIRHTWRLQNSNLEVQRLIGDMAEIATTYMPERP